MATETTSLKQRKTASSQPHEHSHSHSGFLHSHSHGHGEEDDGHGHAEASMILDALRGRGDSGARATLLGVFANIGLTAVKGVAGWYLNSASLIADAGHSLSDLLGDFVTLVSYTLSQRPPSAKYPNGYGKFESLGTITVSILLILGGIGVSLHSYALLTQSLAPLLSRFEPDSFLHVIISFIISSAPDPDDHDHHHGIEEGEDGLSPHALYFPILSILVKEYLYRIMSRIAKETGSSVLMANALHHRSDAWGSLVSMAAIIGGIFLPGLGIDPLGGLLVGALILVSGFNIFAGAVGELTDAGVSSSARETYAAVLEDAADAKSLRPALVKIRDVRGVRSGGAVFVDAVAEVATIATAKDIVGIVEGLERGLKAEKKEVREVRVKIVLAS